MKLPISNICFIKETAHVQIIYPFKFMTKAKLSFVSLVNIQRFYGCKLRGTFFFLISIFYYVSYGKINTTSGRNIKKN